MRFTNYLSCVILTTASGVCRVHGAPLRLCVMYILPPLSYVCFFPSFPYEGPPLKIKTSGLAGGFGFGGYFRFLCTSAMPVSEDRDRAA